MSATLHLQWDSQDLDFFRRGKAEAALLKTLRQAGGDSIRSIRSNSSKSIRQKKRFKVKDVNRAMKMSYPTGRGVESLVWRMDVKGELTPLSKFPHRQNKQGVSVFVNRDGRKMIHGAFVARMKSGHEGVFVRRGKKRLPIDELFSTRISDVFRDQDMIPTLQRKAQSVFASAYARLLKVNLEKK